MTLQAYKKRMEYVQLLEPYEGKKITDVPIDVLKKADKLLKEAQEADKKYQKTAGF